MAEPDRQPIGDSVPEIAGPPMEFPGVQHSAPVFTETQPPAPVSFRSGFPTWSFWDVVAVLCLTLVTIFVCSAIALWIGHTLLAHRHLTLTALAQNPLIIVGSQVASYPIVIGFMAVMIRNRSGGPFWSSIHWRWPGRTASAFFAGGILLAFSIEGIAHFLPIPKSLPLDKFFNDAHSAYLMAFFGVALAPLLEELFFRGMLYPVLRRAMGVVVALVITAAAFAGIHGAQLGYAWAPILSIFVVGVVLTLVRQVAGSVAACFLIHSGYNFTLFALLWVGTDHFRHLDKLNV